VRPLAAVERDYILAVVAANGGNRVRTAERLEIGTARFAASSCSTSLRSVGAEHESSS